MPRVPASGPTNASIVIVGEAPGASEELAMQPFVGASGSELTKMLHEAGITRTACYITNVCKIRPPNNDIGAFYLDKSRRKPGPELLAGREELLAELARVQPKLIITLGETALWAVTGKRGITDWRGSMLEVDGRIVIPTYHPAAILRQWDWRPIAVHDLRRAAQLVATGIKKPDYRFTIRPSFEAVMFTLDRIYAQATAYDARGDTRRDGVRLAVDIETRGGHIACLGIAWSRTDAMCIPFMCVERAEGYWSLEEELAIVCRLRDVLLHPAVRIIGQNFLYDLQYLIRYWGLNLPVCDDTMLMQHVCFPGLPKGLDFLSSMYCEYHVFWKHEGKDWDSKTPEDQLWSYNCKDAVITFEVSEVLADLLTKFSLDEPYEFQMELYKPVLAMMLRGVKINTELRAQMNLTLEHEKAIREEYIQYVAGEPLNINSPKQMKEFFYTTLGQQIVKHRKTKQPTVDDEALEKMALREPLLRPIITAIGECRSIKVYQSTFVQASLDHDQRMRCSFNIGGTETYRFSSSANAFGTGTNMQNPPRVDPEAEAKRARGEFALPTVRTMFIPDTGYTIVDADLAGADAQIVAWEANDTKLKQMFREKVKLHAVNAKLIYGSAAGADGKREPYYTRTKMGVHASNYGASARTVAAAIGITVREAEDFQRKWFGEHPEIRQWHRAVEESLITTRSVRNKFGYRRFYFDRIDSILPEALAWIPQSSVACTINRGMLRVYNTLPQVQLLLQVHDSIVVQVPTPLLDKLIPLILECLRVTIPYNDPLIIPSGIKHSAISWGHCE